MDITTTWQDVSLVIAGAIGGAVAIIHGVLIQRYLATPLRAQIVATHVVRATTARLLTPLLQFSTFAWFLGGLALVAAAIWLRGEGRLSICLLVGLLYLFGAVANFWATRGRHPGWILMMVALALIIAGAGPSVV